MANGDTKTEQMLDILANGGDTSQMKGCCNTKTQNYILDAADRIQRAEDEIEEIKNNPDVADIVDTYQDLENYDKSTLTDKDVIRVLNDETHDGESTYYRYSTNTGEFTYIGESKQYTNFVGTDGQDAGKAGLVPAPTSSDADKYLKSDGTWATAGGGGDTVYSTKTTSSGATGGAVYIGNLNSSQTEQSDPTTTDNHYKYFWALPNNNSDVPTRYSVNILGRVYNSFGSVVAIGYESLAHGNNSYDAGQTAIGQSTEAQGNHNVALGSNAICRNNYSASIGSFATTTRVGEVNVGTGNNNYGYNSTKYRVIGGVHDGQDAHDAVTVGQINAVIDAINSATGSNISHIGA